MGAFNLLSNGAMTSRAGAALVALTAQAYKVPVIVCCETYKFSEKLQSDSLVWNEMGDPEEIARLPQRDTKPGPLADPSTRPASLKLLNVTYDITPPHLISMIITEVGMIPPSSVPVVVREVRKEAAMM